MLLFARSQLQARHRVHGIIGVPPVFPIRAKSAHRSLKRDRHCLQSRAQISSPHSVTQAGRLCYFSLGLSVTHVTESMVS
jgi:hypothetical protein